jgi:DNA-binding Lrp family transcriptional regulator
MPNMNAFVHIFVESAQMDNVVSCLQKISNISEIFHVTGEFDLVTMVSCEDTEQFRDVLKNRIMKIEGVRSTVSSVVLHSYGQPVARKLQTLVTA